MKNINIVYSNKTADRMEHMKHIENARIDYYHRTGNLLPPSSFPIVGNQANTIFYITRKVMERASRKGSYENKALSDFMADYPNAILMVC